MEEYIEGIGGYPELIDLLAASPDENKDSGYECSVLSLLYSARKGSPESVSGVVEGVGRRAWIVPRKGFGVCLVSHIICTEWSRGVCSITLNVSFATQSRKA